jgi:hypothetical protein
VVDLNLGKVLKRITGLKGPQDGAYAAGLDLVFVASGGDGEDLSPASRYPVLPQPDSKCSAAAELTGIDQV